MEMPIDARTESVLTDVRWVLRIVRSGPRDLTLTALSLLAFSAAAGIHNFSHLPSNAAFWLVGLLTAIGCVMFGFAIFSVAKQFLPPPPPPPVEKPSAIRGPLSFTPAHADLFPRLGRNPELGKLLGFVMDDQVPIVVVRGESGCGKTSLLRAGLSHGLAGKAKRLVYWEALPNNSAPALLSAICADWPATRERPKNLDAVLQLDPPLSMAIIIDQFEQLSPDQDRGVFDTLRQAAKLRAPHSITWIVCYRREYEPLWRDFELSISDFHPPVVSLMRFSLLQAEEVMGTLASEAGLRLDRSLVTHVINACADHGSVSPVDIGITLQVLSELGRTGNAESLTLRTYLEQGGDQGVLENYLEQQLSRFGEAERQAIFRALLSLVDLDTDQRVAAGRSGVELARIAEVPAANLSRVLGFLASHQVRLLEVLELPSSEGIVYRLPHERLVPVLRHLTRRLSGEAEEASRTLARRYRIWSMDRRAAYLLSGKELAAVQRSSARIEWGDSKADKQRFVSLSLKRRTWVRSLGAALICVLAGGIYLGVRYKLNVDARNQIAAHELLELPPDLYAHPRLESLTLESPIVARLDWIPEGLKRLEISINRDGTVIAFPNSLIELAVTGNIDSPRAYSIVDASKLPRSLVSLTLSRVRVRDGEALRSLHLTELNIADAEAESQGGFDLPESLTKLTISNRDLAGLERLTSLQRLAIEGGYGDFDAAKLPSSVTSLSLIGVKVMHPEALAQSHVTRFETDQAELLDFLPLGIRGIWLQGVTLDAPKLANLSRVTTLDNLSIGVLDKEAPPLDIELLPRSLTGLGLAGLGDSELRVAHWDRLPATLRGLQRLSLVKVTGVSGYGGLDSLQEFSQSGHCLEAADLDDLPLSVRRLAVDCIGQEDKFFASVARFRSLQSLTVGSFDDFSYDVPPSLVQLSVGTAGIELEKFSTLKNLTVLKIDLADAHNEGDRFPREDYDVNLLPRSLTKLQLTNINLKNPHDLALMNNLVELTVDHFNRARIHLPRSLKKLIVKDDVSASAATQALLELGRHQFNSEE